MNKYALLLVFALTVCFSCSSDDDNLQLTAAEKVVGTWQGSYLQDDYGVASIDVTITELRANQVVAQPRYGANDLSLCNEDFFDCSIAPDPCTTSWEYISSSSTTFTFEESSPSTSNCAPGTVTLILTDDNTMSYRWVDISDATNVASGSLNRR